VIYITFFGATATLLLMQELAVGDTAPDLILLDPEERPVALSSLWQRAPLALIFLRHFG
jgi:peroxiredoxin